MAGGAAVEAVRERVARLEQLVGMPQTETEPLAERLDHVVAAVKAAQKSVAELSVELGRTVADALSDMRAMADTFQATVQGLEEELSLVKRALSGLGGRVEAPLKVKVPDPKAFGCTRSAKDLENFLWDMEQYFKATHVPDAEKVTITSMYLTGDAKLWWRTRVEDDVDAGHPKIEAWDALKKELRDQFLPCNVAWLARDALRKLKHTGLVRDYVKEFSSLMLDIKNMSKEDKLFNFMAGLQTWAQMELRRQGVKDLPSTIATADSLVDYRLEKASNSETGKPKHKGKNKGAGVPEEKDVRLDKSKVADGQQDKGKAKSGCFICNGPHRARECPKRKELSAIVLEEASDAESDPDSEIITRVNPLQLCNTIHVENATPFSDLMFVKILVNDTDVIAMVDTSATHTFVTERVVQAHSIN